MSAISIEGKTQTVTLDPEGKWNEAGEIDLGFKGKDKAGRLIVTLTIEDLDAIEKAIAQYRNDLSITSLQSVLCRYKN